MKKIDLKAPSHYGGKPRLPRLILAVLMVVISLPMVRPCEAARLMAMDEKGKLRGPFVALEGHISLFSDIAESSLVAGTFGYGARGGYRWNSWGLFLAVEHNMWVATEYHAKVVQGAVNVGLGGEFIYADGFVRTSVAAGPSILAYDTVLDDAGNVGLFLEARPLGLRWTVHEYLVIGLDPLNFAVVAPVLSGIPLVYIQYRTMIYLEAVF